MRWAISQSFVVSTIIVALSGVIFGMEEAVLVATILIGLAALYAVVRFAVNAIKLAQIKKYPTLSPGFDLLIVAAILGGTSLGGALGSFIASLFY